MNDFQAHLVGDTWHISCRDVRTTIPNDEHASAYISRSEAMCRAAYPTRDGGVVATVLGLALSTLSTPAGIGFMIVIFVRSCM